MIQAQDDPDIATGEFSEVQIIAPDGTKKHRMALVANRLRPVFRALNLRGTWTFTWSGPTTRKAN